jgi:hypothetical protein
MNEVPSTALFTRMRSDHWPFQSAPASQMTALAAPGVTAPPTAPVALVQGTVQVVPPALQMARVTFRVGESASATS